MKTSFNWKWSTVPYHHSTRQKPSLITKSPHQPTKRTDPSAVDRHYQVDRQGFHEFVPSHQPIFTKTDLPSSSSSSCSSIRLSLASFALKCVELYTYTSSNIKHCLSPTVAPPTIHDTPPPSTSPRSELGSRYAVAIQCFRPPPALPGLVVS